MPRHPAAPGGRLELKVTQDDATMPAPSGRLAERESDGAIKNEQQMNLPFRLHSMLAAYGDCNC